MRIIKTYLQITIVLLSVKLLSLLITIIRLVLAYVFTGYAIAMNT